MGSVLAIQRHRFHMQILLGNNPTFHIYFIDWVNLALYFGVSGFGRIGARLDFIDVL